MRKLVIANSNPLHKIVIHELSKVYEIIEIIESRDLDYEKIAILKPDYIFFLHWSTIIPIDIFSKFECILFHMTDLPFGRGGSPLQNLILLGYQETKLTAIKVNAVLDSGDIYSKKDLSLYGTAEEIFLRAGGLMQKMISEIVENETKPIPQTGEPTFFKRRKPEESNLADVNNLSELFDFIRMLDCEGYPKAFIETKNFKFEFSRASVRKDCLIADVIITKK